MQLATSGSLAVLKNKGLIFNKKTNEFEETNIEPLRHHLETYEPTNDPNIRVLKQTKECYIDTRYEAKLRLYNYVTYIKKGLEVPIYKPFANTDIGVNTPILNF